MNNSGGPPRGVGFGGKKPPNGSRVWIDGDLCRGKVSLDPRVDSTFAPGDLLWWSETPPAGLSREFVILRIQAFGCSNDAAAVAKRDAAVRHKEYAHTPCHLRIISGIVLHNNHINQGQILHFLIKNCKTMTAKMADRCVRFMGK